MNNQDTSSPAYRKFAKANPITAQRDRRALAKELLGGYAPLGILAIHRGNSETGIHHFYDVYFLENQPHIDGPVIRPVPHWVTPRAARVLGLQPNMHQRIKVRDNGEMRDHLLTLRDAMEHVHPNTIVEVL